jgi:hypothetical protein
MMCPSMNLLMQLLGSVRKTKPIFEVRGRGWRLLLAVVFEAPGGIGSAACAADSHTRLLN